MTCAESSRTAVERGPVRVAHVAQPYRWLLRRPPTTEPGAEVFSYAGVVQPILIAFIVLSAVEIPILDLILAHTLPSLRKVVLGSALLARVRQHLTTPAC